MANRFWVGGGSTTNWSATANTNWSTTSGGANNASVPGAADVAIFDANSGAGTSVLDIAFTILGLDCSGFTGTLTHNSGTLTLTSDDTTLSPIKTFRLAAGMTYTAATNGRIISLSGASNGPVSITTAGKTLGSLTLGVGGASTATFTAADDMTIRSDGTLNLTSGTYNANGFNVTLGLMSSSNANTRTMTMGSGTWTLNSATGNPWDYTTNTNLTHSATTAPIIVNASNPNSGAQYVFSNKSYGPITFNGVTTGGQVQQRSINIGGATGATYASMTLNAPLFCAFGAAITITGALTINGVGFNDMVSLRGASSGTTFTIGAASTANWALFDSTIMAGAGTLTTTNCVSTFSSTDSGFVLNGPSGGSSGAKVFGS